MNSRDPSSNRTGPALRPVWVAIALVVLGGLFFLVPSIHIGTAVTTGALPGAEPPPQWTPDKIAAEPEAYLGWALAEVSRTETLLHQQGLALSSEINKAGRLIAAHRQSFADVNSWLGEAKSAYRAAAEENRWPATLEARSVGEEELKIRILEADAQLTVLAELAETYADSRQILERKKTEVDVKLAEVRRLRTKLASDLEILRVNQTLENVGRLSAQFTEIQAGATVLLADPSVLSLEALVAPAGIPARDGVFDRILAEE